MADETPESEKSGKPKFGRRPRQAGEKRKSSQDGSESQSSQGQQKKPKVRIGPKNRRPEIPETVAPKEPPKREPQPSRDQRPSRGPSNGPPRQDRKQVQGQKPKGQNAATPEQGGIRRKRRRRKGRRPEDGPTQDGPAESLVKAPSPFPQAGPKPKPFVGRQVLPPVEDDMDEVPSGIFLTSDLLGGDNSDVDSDSDSDSDLDSDYYESSDPPPASQGSEGAMDSAPPLVQRDTSSHPDNRVGRERKRRKKNRRERQELPPVDRSLGYWWAEQWVRSFEMLFPSNASRSRMAKGRTYARRGQVLELEVGPNGVLARVQGSRPRPYQVRLELNRLRRETWGRILHQLVGKATFLAQLLEGHLPPEIEEVFFSAGARLFPHGDVDIRARCNCPDPVVPCKHVSALNYALADALQRDPFLLFAMRGKGRDQFLQDLREMRGRDRGNPLPPPTDIKLTEFWRMGRLSEVVLRSTGWSMSNDPARLLQSLGEPQLEGIREGLFLPMLEATYRQVAESMRRLPKDA